MAGLVAPSSQFFALPPEMQVSAFAKAFVIASGRSPQESVPTTGEAETVRTPFAMDALALHFVTAMAAEGAESALATATSTRMPRIPDRMIDSPFQTEPGAAGAGELRPRRMWFTLDRTVLPGEGISRCFRISRRWRE